MQYLPQIERDIDRTFPRHLQFEKEGEGTSSGQEALRRLLQMYAKTDGEVGYCQGMAFIAGLLLTYMPEEDAVYCFMAALKVITFHSTLFSHKLQSSHFLPSSTKFLT
jgi:TBC1 domain family member 10